AFKADTLYGERFADRIVNAHAAKVDAKAVLETANNCLENATRILPFTNGPRNLVQKAQPLQLSLEPMLGCLMLGDLGPQNLNDAIKVGGSGANSMIELVIETSKGLPLPA